MKPDIYNVDCKNGFKELESETIDLIVTDPPYEVNYGERSKELSALGIGFEISDYFYDISIERLRNTQYHKWF